MLISRMKEDFIMPTMNVAYAYFYFYYYYVA
jgi:hypothetical protein